MKTALGKLTNLGNLIKVAFVSNMNLNFVIFIFNLWKFCGNFIKTVHVTLNLEILLV